MGSYDVELRAGGVKENNPSVTERLLAEKAQLEMRLKDVNETLDLLSKYPDIQKVIDVVSKHTRF